MIFFYWSMPTRLQIISHFCILMSSSSPVVHAHLRLGKVMKVNKFNSTLTQKIINRNTVLPSNKQLKSKSSTRPSQTEDIRAHSERSFEFLEWTGCFWHSDDGDLIGWPEELNKTTVMCEFDLPHWRGTAAEEQPLHSHADSSNLPPVVQVWWHHKVKEVYGRKLQVNHHKTSKNSTYLLCTHCGGKNIEKTHPANTWKLESENG